jgi:hypothetical protein
MFLDSEDWWYHGSFFKSFRPVDSGGSFFFFGEIADVTV